MLNPLSKKIIALAISLVIISLIYYGSFLPLRKSRLFIATLRNFSSYRNLAEVEKAIAGVLDYPSPSGQEELVRQFANTGTNILQNNKQPEVAAALLELLGKYYQPIMARGGGGLSFSQNLYIMGALNELAALNTQQVKYMAAAEKYFEQGHEISPKRPQFLYGLFEVYRFQRKFDKARAIGQEILKYWPEDNRVVEDLKQMP